MVWPGTFRERGPPGDVEQEVSGPPEGQGEEDRAEPSGRGGQELLAAEGAGQEARVVDGGGGGSLLLLPLLLPLLNAAAAALSLAPPHGRDEDLVPVDGARVGVVAAVRVLPGEVGDLFFRIFFFFFEKRKLKKVSPKERESGAHQSDLGASRKPQNLWLTEQEGFQTHSRGRERKLRGKESEKKDAPVAASA